jgi:hypothetical protein
MVKDYICKLCGRPIYNGETIVHLGAIIIHSGCFREKK